MTSAPVCYAAEAADWNGSSRLKSSVRYTANNGATITKSITVPETTTLTVANSRFAYIGKNGSITVNGTLNVKGTLNIGVFSSVTINGRLNIASTGRICGSGSLTLSEAARITGRARIECAINSGNDDEFLRADGRKITDGNGNAVQLRGIALTSGMWLDYGLGSKMSNLKENYKEMSRMGFNSTRMCFSYTLFEDDDKPYTYKQSGWDFLDENIAYAKRYGIYLVLNIHKPQGGYQSQGNGMALWQNRENQKRLIALWTAIAEHCKDEPIVVGFGIVNEPYAPRLENKEKTVGQWKTLAQEITDGIRTVDKRHIIFVEGLMACKNTNGTNYTWDFSDEYNNMFTINDDNAVYEFHFYSPFEFSHQNFDWAGRGGKLVNYPSEKKNYTYVSWLDSAGGTGADITDTGWQYSESNLYKVTDERITSVNVSLTAHNTGKDGSALFDDIKIDEYDENMKFVRTVYSTDFSVKPDELSVWSQDGSAKIEYVYGDGNKDMGCVKVYGSTDITTADCYSNFDVKQDYYYKISGYVKCVNAAPNAHIAADIGFSQCDIEIITYNKAYLEECMSYALKFSKDNDVPLYVGEFGCNNEAVSQNRGGDKWVTDLLEIFDENGLSYDYWSARGGFGIYNDGDEAYPLSMCKELYELFMSYYGTSVTDKRTGINERSFGATGTWEDPIPWDGSFELDYGLSYIMARNVTIKSLTVPNWAVLNIDEGFTLSADTLNVNGSIRNNGTIRVNDLLEMNGSLTNNGTIIGKTTDSEEDIHLGAIWCSKKSFDGNNELYMPWRNITDISELSKMNHFEIADLSYNDIDSISSLSEHKNLVTLKLQHNNITSIKPLSSLTELQTLMLSANEITSLSSLKKLTKLKTLDVGGNYITKLSSIKELTELEYLDLSLCMLSGGISSLSGMTKLKTLRLGVNYLTDISAVSAMTSLENLELQDNEISDLSPLSGLKSLTELSLPGNEIKRLYALRGLKGLTKLNLNCNEITSVKYLGKLTNLTELRLNYNQITDVTPLKKLKKLKSLYLYGNPLTEKQIDELQKAIPSCTIYFV